MRNTEIFNKYKELSNSENKDLSCYKLALIHLIQAHTQLEYIYKGTNMNQLRVGSIFHALEEDIDLFIERFGFHL